MRGEVTGDRSPAGEATCCTSEGTDLATRRATICNDEGLHARPAELVARTAMAHSAEVAIVRGEHRVDAKSILDLLTLGAAKGVELLVEATGEDADRAAEAVADLINSGFNDDAV